ncbi:hypothetical protein BCR42DRAFT_425266 [Absidia repens]|uniref:Uncharacterized protein n=1 Tax=Absidia repens TaxID=90262 RepID=A0A1X2I2R1_9FUNG|nr:hypothetical protein BCR42DRAFT_425266 [Absidia repens]
MVPLMSSQQRHVILVGIFFAFLLTLFYYQHVTHPALNAHSATTTSALDLVLPDQQQHHMSAPKASPGLSTIYATDPSKRPQPCDKGDISWLASDRQHWDGWKTKSFFLKPDGNFTLDDVIIEQENGLCIVVLLGPIPAANKIKVVPHYAPPDLITMTALGKHYSIPITLHQYPKQSNAYYANVYFRNSDTYVLKSITEYRSHFWETPIQHRYQPFSFDSSNKAMVTPHPHDQQPERQRPACGGAYPTLEGSWRNDTTKYEFIPDHCDMKYTRQDGLRCLRRKTIHVYGDQNVRRNLKTLASPTWCDMTTQPDAACICNDDNEDADPHSPWVTDATIPLMLGDNTIHYHPWISSITNLNSNGWHPSAAAADIVILGVGNADIALSRITPRDFAHGLTQLIDHHLSTSSAMIIVRTPQFFGTGQHYLTSWNAGRSRAFANVVRDLVQLYPRRVKLWDTHQLGIEHTTCRYHGTLYTRRNVIDVENQLLMGLFCSGN